MQYFAIQFDRGMCFYNTNLINIQEQALKIEFINTGLLNIALKQTP